MSAPSAFFLQQSGSAEITLTRPSPAIQGTLSVEFSTDSAAPPESVPATTITGPENVSVKNIAAATPGQQFLPVDETVTFQPGQTALTVTVPIVPNAANPGIVAVGITATPLVTGGIPVTGAFAIVSGPDQLPLAITNAQIVPQALGALAVVLTFNEPLAPASVGSLENYRITPTGRSGPVSPLPVSRKRASSRRSSTTAPPLGGIAAGADLAALAFLSAVGATYKLPQGPPPIPLRSATYDAATNTVTLVTAKPLHLSRVYQVVIGPARGRPGFASTMPRSAKSPP